MRNKDHENTAPQREQLDWEAFCYLSGDMPSDEVARFESRLAGDQGAREAVARAVELTGAVWSAFETVGQSARFPSLPQVAAKQRPTWGIKPELWVAAALLLIAAWGIWKQSPGSLENRGSDQVEQRGSQFDPDLPEVSDWAIIWATQREPFEPLAAATNGDADIQRLTQELGAELAAEPEVPLWMLAALRSLQ